MIVVVPTVIIGILIALIYLPPVQRAIVAKACEEIGARSGYKVDMKSVTLSFPLKLKARDFSMSKGETLYFSGNGIDANISLLPLFSGEVEINYILLEGIDIDTHDLLPDTHVEGKVGYLRAVARNADLQQAVADIRQLYITDTDIDIALAGSSDDEESQPLEWIVKLHSGRIRNSRIGISIPDDTLKAGLYIDELQLDRGSIDIPTSSFAVKSLALHGCSMDYDKGEKTPEQTPLDHISLENININATGLRYATLDDISANITHISLEQPGGLAITDASTLFTSNSDTLTLHRFSIESRNGSRISCHSTIPQKALKDPQGERFVAELSAVVDKRDLARLVTPDVYDKLHYFNGTMLEAGLALGGNIQQIDIDTVMLNFNGVGSFNANGNIKEILDKDKRNGYIALKGEIDDIGLFTGHHNDSVDIKATADGKIDYSCDIIGAEMALRSADAVIDATGHYDIADTTYNAEIKVEQLALANIMPDIPLHRLKMGLKAKGCGTDLFDTGTHYDVEIEVDTLHYAGYRLHSISAKALQSDNVSSIEVDGKERELLFGIDATTTLNASGIDNRTTIELTNADLKEIGVVDSLLKVSANIDIAATSDLKESHNLKVNGSSMAIMTKQNRFTPEDLSLDFTTSPGGTSIKMLNGDLKIDGEMDCGYNGLFAAMDEVARMNGNIMSGKSKLYHLDDYERVLPRISLDFKCGERNVLHNFLAFTGIGTKRISVDADISPKRGLNINGNILGFSSGDVRLDSIKFVTRQHNEKLHYIMGGIGLHIASLNEEHSHNALLYGNIMHDTITTNIMLRDDIGGIESKLSFATHLTPGNLNIHFAPEALILGAPFAFSKLNHINIGKAMSVDANVVFTGSDNAGFHLYTIPDEKAKYNANLNIFNINLSRISSSLPGLPDIGGNIFAKLNYRKDKDGDTFTCNANANGITYNGYKAGDGNIKLIYSPKTDEVHDISCTIGHNGKEVAFIRSDYRRGHFNGNISLTRLPLGITQAFIDREGVIIDGYLNSKIGFKGTLADMRSNGYIQLDSTYAYSPMLGATLHPAEEKIMIENNRINLQKYHIYDKANTPFVINGIVDVTNLLNPRLNLWLNATNYEILNTPRDAGKMVYGKMYVDLRSMLRGTLNDINMAGDLTVLSNSNFAYVIPETAFDSNKDLDGLVEFVNFNDTTTVEQLEPTDIDLGNIKANLNIIIKEGAKLSLDFDSSRENYVSIEGDGNLNATYDSKNGFGVNGIYKLSGGQVKLTLPVIPLKTFYIQEGGRLTWTGDLFNPTLDVTAMESTTVAVEMDDNSIQPVVFNAGVVVSNTINDLGIDFTMSAPDNSVIQSQLNALDRETLNRYAVAMIITGTYLGARQGVTATNALSSFLDAKINEISGTAIKNFDVNIGINDGLNAETGNTYTSYSFSFSKRFFNDRITVVIGGEVNSGDRPDKASGSNTFINNVSLEWRLNEEGNRYIRIFYDKNYQSLLEGEITETGVGYVYKRKLNSLKELFTFKRKNKKNKQTETTSTRQR